MTEDFARRYTEAWCSHSPDAVASFFATDGSLSVNSGSPAIGREAISKVALGFYETFPDMQVMMDRLALVDGKPQYHWTLIGTSVSGKRVKISGFEKWTMSEGGLIQKSEGQFDAADYHRQLAAS